MSIVLVDSKYFGQYLTRARKTVNLRRVDAARILSVSHRELIKIENGKIIKIFQSFMMILHITLKIF